ncbi:uncharacterized protein LOC134215916 [Armigeres subalbatus]|uniref:uncharacterized protein LOC134215916 n=1 Tax=Armigeres subalbatus TaxID=124917 RepID=UPI002ED450B5
MSFDARRSALEPFNDTVDSKDLRREWEEWHRAFELTLELRNVETQHEKLVLLLAHGGRGLQRIFYNLRPMSDEVYPKAVAVPLMPVEIPEYDNAVKRLNRFFVGKRNERIELEVFRSMKQAHEETINQFLLRLRAQATRCDFYEREEKEILQQITMGARDERVRDKGLEDVMNLDELINYAINREILLKQKERAQRFSEERLPTPGVNQIRNKRPRYNDVNQRKYGANMNGQRRIDLRDGTGCSRCGSSIHKADSANCVARNARCNNCHNIGHFARKCRGAGNKRTFDTRNKSNRPRAEANFVSYGAELKEEAMKQTEGEQGTKVFS